MIIEAKVGEQFMGSITLTEDFMSITLNEDGSVSMVAMGELETSGGTWTDDGKESVTITVEGEAKVCFCDGDTLVIEEDGAKITLKKSK